REEVVLDDRVDVEAGPVGVLHLPQQFPVQLRVRLVRRRLEFGIQPEAHRRFPVRVDPPAFPRKGLATAMVRPPGQDRQRPARAPARGGWAPASHCLAPGTSHRMTVRSSLPEATARPSGLKATAWTSPPCPSNVAVHLPVATSHNLTVRSAPPETSRVPS